MKSFENDFEANTEILLFLLDFREIKKQIGDVDALQKDLELIDSQLSKMVAEWNGYTLDDKVKNSDSILKLIQNSRKTKHPENIYSRLEKFQNSFHEFVNNPKNELIGYSGIFSTVPTDVLVLVISRLEHKDYINITSTCCRLLSIRMEIIKNPETMLELFSRIPVPYKLPFIENYFRPASGELYQNLKNVALKKSNFKTYLCYTVVTNNINELDADYLDKVYGWLQKHDKKMFEHFKSALFAIYGVLKKNKKIFQRGCPRGEYLSGVMDDFKKPPKYYFNLAGAKFPSDFFNGDEIEANQYKNHTLDLRFANLENTIWQCLAIKKVCLRQANLSNSIMDDLIVEDSYARLDLGDANCRDVVIRDIDFHDDISPIRMYKTNFERAKFEKISGKIEFRYKCNLINTDFTNTSINGIRIQSELDLTGMKLLSPEDIATTDSLAEKLKQVDFETLNKISWFNGEEYEKELTSLKQIIFILAKNICELVNTSTLDDTALLHE